MVSHPCLSKRQRRLYAAVVELHALPDAIGATPQDHRLAPVRAVRLVLLRIGGVQIGSLGGKFTRAGIHGVVNRMHFEPRAPFAYRALALTP